ncbi:MAG: UDP-N-acetylglucosamine 1-carboxyvinyltransferase [Bdellovibrionales bacterium]|nr:UDP-N-acetylglucosamine 1-carboxyvinyltransferase [Bdellovibrionales bacterium]
MHEKITSPSLNIKGGQPLYGEVCVSGAKNSVLPLLFSTLLAEGEHEFHNVPCLTDVTMAGDILTSLGLFTKQEGPRLRVITPPELGKCPDPSAVKKMRAGILCLGPLLARGNEVQLPLPGGCVIGKRPVDLHLEGLRKLGASLEIKDNLIYAKTEKGLKGSEITLKLPSVGGTENLLMAAVLAEGKTRLQNIALEPEIFDLISYLKKMSALIKQTAPRELLIEGVEKLTPPPSHSVIPDRIEAGTLLMAGAITKGEVTVKNCEPKHLTVLLNKLKECGFIIETGETHIALKKSSVRKSVHIKTHYYPGFPTDLQAQFMALMTQLEGLSSVEETVFENRFRHISELKRLKADIEVTNQTAHIKGPTLLKGANVEATDLRAGAGLVLAGLAAEGETSVFGTHHLIRGYDNLHGKLQTLGASIDLSDSPKKPVNIEISPENAV